MTDTTHSRIATAPLMIHLPLYVRQIVVVVSLLVLGLALRTFYIERATVWHDEALTIGRLTGVTRREFREHFSAPRTMMVATVKAAFHPASHNTVSGLEAIARASLRDPNMPLYYLLARVWCAAFGDSLVVVRSFSTVLTILAGILVTAFCYRFFPRLSGTAIFMACMSAPFWVHYGQEGRAYALLLVFAVGSSWCIFARLRGDTRRSGWLFFVLTVGGMLTHPLYALVVLSQICAAWLTAPSQERGRLTGFVGALLLSSALSAPWYLAILGSPDSGGHFTGRPSPQGPYLQQLLLSLARFLFEPEIVSGVVLRYSLLTGALVVFVGGVALLLRDGPRERAFVVGSLLPVALLIASDLIFGGHRATIIRYLFPLALLQPVALGRLCAERGVGTIVMMVVGAIMIVSSAVAIQHPSWNKRTRVALDIPAVRTLVSSAPPTAPIVTSLDIFDLYSIVHSERDDRVLIVQRGEGEIQSQLIDEYEELYLLHRTGRDDPPECPLQLYRGAGLELRRCYRSGVSPSGDR